MLTTRPHLESDGAADVEAGVSVVHDAVTVVLGLQGELQRVPRVVDPLVWQHVEVVDVDVVVPVLARVRVQQPHVVQQLVGHDTNCVLVVRGEAGEDPES